MAKRSEEGDPGEPTFHRDCPGVTAWRWLPAAAFAWGFAEATFFFLVPEVLLTLAALRDRRGALRAVGFALIGALMGGGLMLCWARVDPEAARAALERVPAIDGALVEDVRASLERRDGAALFLGGVSGRPYKIFAVEWGADDGRGLPAFLALAFAARGLRFALGVFLAHAIAAVSRHASPDARAPDLWVWALFWTALYGAYFAAFGW